MAVTHSITKTCTGSGGAISGSYSQVGVNEATVDTQLAAASTNVAVSAAYGPGGTASGNLLSIEITSTQNCTIKTNGTGTSEVQTLTITGTPTGGTFALGYGGLITAPIAYNAIASAVQTALRALASIGGTNVTCAGGPLPGTPVTITFSSTFANTNVALITSDGGAGLTGGTSPTVAVATTTAGLPQETLSLSAGIPITWDVSGPHACPFAGAVTGWYVTSTNAAKLQARILTA